MTTLDHVRFTVAVYRRSKALDLDEQLAVQ
jgi:hypothetical protein